MGRLTGGRVSYAEKRNISQYENKSAEIELAFALDEGDDPDTVIGELEIQCKARVHRMLGIDEGSKVPLASKIAADLEMKTASEVSAEAAKKRPGRPPKARVEKVPEPDEDEDGMDDILGEAPKDEPAEITDEDLIKKLTKHPLSNKETGEPKRVKALVVKYAPRLSEIPKEKRAAFLKELAELKAAA
jgi:hypothetical protein